MKINKGFKRNRTSNEVDYEYPDVIERPPIINVQCKRVGKWKGAEKQESEFDTQIFVVY